MSLSRSIPCYQQLFYDILQLSATLAYQILHIPPAGMLLSHQFVHEQRTNYIAFKKQQLSSTRYCILLSAPLAHEILHTCRKGPQDFFYHSIRSLSFLVMSFGLTIARPTHTITPNRHTVSPDVPSHGQHTMARRNRESSASSSTRARGNPGDVQFSFEGRHIYTL